MKIVNKEFTTVSRFDFIGKGKCSRCGKDTSWRLVKIRTWLTVLGIPIFPLETKHKIVCYRCAKGKTIDEATFQQLQIDAKKNKKAKNANEINKIKEIKYVSRTKTQQNYLDELKKFEREERPKRVLGEDGKLLKG